MPNFDSDDVGEYTESIDAGGKSENYSQDYEIGAFEYDSKGIELEPSERERTISAISTNYYSKKHKKGKIQYQSVVYNNNHILYFYISNGFGNYTIIGKIDFVY